MGFAMSMTEALAVGVALGLLHAFERSSLSFLASSTATGSGLGMSPICTQSR
jgi:hypothetical protein